MNLERLLHATDNRTEWRIVHSVVNLAARKAKNKTWMWSAGSDESGVMYLPLVKTFSCGSSENVST